MLAVTLQTQLTVNDAISRNSDQLFGFAFGASRAYGRVTGLFRPSGARLCRVAMRWRDPAHEAGMPKNKKARGRGTDRGIIP